MPLVRQTPKKKSAARAAPYLSNRPEDASEQQAVGRSKRETAQKDSREPVRTGESNGRDAAAIMRWAADVASSAEDGQDQESDDGSTTVVDEGLSDSQLVKSKLVEVYSSSSHDTPLHSLSTVFKGHPRQ